MINQCSRACFGDGSEWGINHQLRLVAPARRPCTNTLIGADFVGGSPAHFILGDNIFYGHGSAKCSNKPISVPKARAARLSSLQSEPAKRGRDGCEISGSSRGEARRPKDQLCCDRTLLLRRYRCRKGTLTAPSAANWKSRISTDCTWTMACCRCNLWGVDSHGLTPELTLRSSTQEVCADHRRAARSENLLSLKRLHGAYATSMTRAVPSR